MRPFGCLVTIFNTLDSLGKFDGKVDEGFLVGYYVSSKAFKVFNSRTSIVQETLHVNFLENKPNVAVVLSQRNKMTRPREAKVKSPVESFTGYRDLSAEFKDCSDNNINKVNAAELEDITYSDDEDDVGAEADFNNLETSITFCRMKGIKREFNVPRTPQQNGIAERKNRIVIEAARTMLADSLLPIPFWAEAVNTACYVQNRVLVTKPHYKTHFELLHGRTPSIDFMRPFGCLVTILNTLDSLGKFDGKVNEGFLVGYSNNDGDAAFEGKEPNFNAKKPESEVIVSPSSSAHNTFSAAGPLNAAASPTYGKSSFIDSSQLSDDPDMLELEDITYSDDEDDVSVEADFNNLETSITVSLIPITRVYKDPPVSQIIGDLSLTTQTRSMIKVVKDQVARIEAIRLFLAYASFMGFMVYQMDVKSAFLYRTIEEEVYVCQPLGFEDLDHPDKVYKVVKALYGLHQALRAWYETLANYLLENSFQRGKIDQTLFIKRQKGDILLVQIYVDDFIFGATNKDLCKSFEKLRKDKFLMSSMGGTYIIFGSLASTPTDTEKPLLKDPDGEDVDVYTYRVETPLFKGMLVEQEIEEGADEEEHVEGVTTSNAAQGDNTTAHGEVHIVSQEPSIPSPTPPTPPPQPSQDLPSTSQVNDVTRLQALVDKRKVVVIEAIIREALRLDDAKGVDCLPNEEIFLELARMGYEKPSTKLTFYKAFFSSHLVRNVNSTTKFYMYPCFLQLIIRKQVGDVSTHTTKYTSPALTQKVFANMRRVGKGFFGVETPLFEGMLVEQEVDEEGDADENVEEVNAGDADKGDDSAAHGEVLTVTEEPSIPSPTPPTLPPQPPQDIPLTSQVQQTPPQSPQEDKIKPAKVEEVVDVVTTAKLIIEVVTAASKTVTTASAIITTTEAQVPAATLSASHARIAAAPSKRRKGVVIRNPEEESTISTIIPAKTESKDKGKGISDIDWDEAIDHVKLKDKEDLVIDYFKGMSYDDIRLIFEAKFKSNVAFLLKIKEQIEEDENIALQKLNETPIERATKRRKLDEEIIQMINKPYYKIIRADDTHQLYISFLTLLRNFDKEDLEALWSLVKERFSTTKPNNFFDDFLLVTLGAMFEKPDIHAQIWKNQRTVHGPAKVKVWKLLESCAVQIITFTSTQLILLV
nr:putative ribonuclease H-like domain-containing protein [Tanacetum cinerariifolium]